MTMLHTLDVISYFAAKGGVSIYVAEGLGS